MFFFGACRLFEWRVNIFICISECIGVLTHTITLGSKLKKQSWTRTTERVLIGRKIHSPGVSIRGAGMYQFTPWFTVHRYSFPPSPRSIRAAFFEAFHFLVQPIYPFERSSWFQDLFKKCMYIYISYPIVCPVFLATFFGPNYLKDPHATHPMQSLTHFGTGSTAADATIPLL